MYATRWKLSVKGLVLDGSDNLLLLQRSTDSAFNAGKWDFPGGKVDPGEDLAAALLREVFEETGLRVAVQKPVEFCQSGTMAQKIVYLLFLARASDSRVCLSREHGSFAWVPIETARAMDLCVQFREIINNIDFASLKADAAN